MSEDIPLKRCTGPCAQFLPATIEFFYRQKDGKYGLTPRCKTCARQRVSEYHNSPEGKEQHRVYNKQYQKAHAEEMRAYHRAHYQENREHYRELNRAWREKNWSKEASRNYYRKNAQQRRMHRKSYVQRYPTRVQFQQKTYRETNAEKLQAYRKERRKKLPHIVRASDRANFAKRKAYKLQSDGSFTPLQWLDLKSRYEHTCLCCGKQEPEIKLHADHVIPLSCGGSNDIGNIQPLCKSCNEVKHTRCIDYRPLWEERKA